jgi:hypothetical protein
MSRILLVPHGGSKNDTICTVEVKEQRQKEGEKLIAYVSDKALRKELKRRSLLEKEPRSD